MIAIDVPATSHTEGGELFRPNLGDGGLFHLLVVLVSSDLVADWRTQDATDATCTLQPRRYATSAILVAHSPLVSFLGCFAETRDAAIISEATNCF
jgi:hypothetical protein